MLALSRTLPSCDSGAARAPHRALHAALGFDITIALVAKGLRFRRWQSKDGGGKGKDANAVHWQISDQGLLKVALCTSRAAQTVPHNPTQRFQALSTRKTLRLRSERNAVEAARNRAAMWRRGHAARSVRTHAKAPRRMSRRSKPHHQKRLPNQADCWIALNSQAAGLALRGRRNVQSSTTCCGAVLLPSTTRPLAISTVASVNS